MRDAGWWFDAPGMPGSRTIDEQLVGLDRLWPMVKGKSVLDVGAAEGQISHRCRLEGAEIVDAIERRPDAVACAKRLGLNALQADAQTWDPPVSYDVVLLLGVLHKLKRPDQALERYLGKCLDLCVLRLPHDDWPILRDDRSGNIRFNIAGVASKCGFMLSTKTQGPIANGKPPEFVGWLTRVVL